MSGWRGRIGLIKPGYTGVTTAPWFNLAPDGVEIVHTTLGLPSGRSNTVEEFAELLKPAEDLLANLGDAGCDCVVITGVPLVVSQGLEFERAFRRRMEDMLGIPVVTPMEHFAQAMQALGCARVAVSTYFSQAVNEVIAEYLRTFGLDAVLLPEWQRSALASDAMTISHAEARSVTYTDVYRVCSKGVQALREPVDGLMILGGMHTFPAVVPLSEDLGIEVIDNDVSQMWLAYGRIGVRLRTVGQPRLLAADAPRVPAELQPATVSSA